MKPREFIREMKKAVGRLKRFHPEWVEERKAFEETIRELEEAEKQGELGSMQEILKKL